MHDARRHRRAFCFDEACGDKASGMRDDRVIRVASWSSRSKMRLKCVSLTQEMKY
jgi:hypothetical protein